MPDGTQANPATGQRVAVPAQSESTSMSKKPLAAGYVFLDISIDGDKIG